jgi:hypothetical protein
VRGSFLRRAAIAAAVLGVLALLFLASSHWVLGAICAIGAAAAAWAFLQARTVR